MGRGQIASQKRHVAFRIRFSGRAVREIGEAHDWYEARSLGLGGKFESALELQLKRLEQTPDLYAEVVTGVRRALLPQFPYGVFFVIRGDLVHLLAVIHNVRNPKRWPTPPAR